MVALSALLVALLSLPGCAGIIMGSAAARGDVLSPEQIKAYDETGMNVYGCVSLGGPPPAGNSVWIVAPKTAVVPMPRFGDGCHIQNQQ